MTATLSAPPAITAVLLCGGRASRMGGRDKGLIEWQGQPLAQHALRRLRRQSLPLARIAISANRNLAAYAAFGCPVWTDVIADFPGPLGGIFTARRSIPVRALGCVLGAFIFRMVYAIALRMNMPAFMLKAVSSAIVVLAISGPYLVAQGKLLRRRMAARRERGRFHA